MNSLFVGSFPNLHSSSSDLAYMNSRLDQIENHISRFENLNKATMEEVESLEMDYVLKTREVQSSIQLDKEELQKLKNKQSDFMFLTDQFSRKLIDFSTGTGKLNKLIVAFDAAHQETQIMNDRKTDKNIESISNKIDAILLDQIEVTNNHKKVQTQLSTIKSKLEEDEKQTSDAIRSLLLQDHKNWMKVEEIDSVVNSKNPKPDNYLKMLANQLSVLNSDFKEFEENLRIEKKNRAELKNTLTERLSDSSKQISNIIQKSNEDNLLKKRVPDNSDNVLQEFDKKLTETQSKQDEKNKMLHSKFENKIKKDINEIKEHEEILKIDEEKLKDKMKRDIDPLKQVIKKNKSVFFTKLNSLNKNLDIIEEKLDKNVHEMKKELDEKIESRILSQETSLIDLLHMDMKIVSFENHFDNEIADIEKKSESEMAKIKFIIEEGIHTTVQDLNISLTSLSKSIKMEARKQEMLIEKIEAIPEIVTKKMNPLESECQTLNNDIKELEKELNIVLELLRDMSEEKNNLQTAFDNIPEENNCLFISEKEQRDKDLGTIQNDIVYITDTVSGLDLPEENLESIYKSVRKLTESLLILKAATTFKWNSLNKKIRKDITDLKGETGDFQTTVFDLIPEKIFVKSGSVKDKQINEWSLYNAYRWLKLMDLVLKWKNRAKQSLKKN